MIVDKEYLEKRITELQAQREQLIMNVAAVNGAMQEAQISLKKISETESEKSEETMTTNEEMTHG